MPGYIDAISTGVSQGFYITNFTHTSSTRNVTVTIEDAKALSDGVEVAMPAKVGFYQDTVNGASSYSGPLPITIRMKAIVDFHDFKKHHPGNGYKTTADYFFPESEVGNSPGTMCLAKLYPAVSYISQTSGALLKKRSHDLFSGTHHCTSLRAARRGRSMYSKCSGVAMYSVHILA